MTEAEKRQIEAIALALGADSIAPEPAPTAEAEQRQEAAQTPASPSPKANAKAAAGSAPKHGGRRIMAPRPCARCAAALPLFRGPNAKYCEPCAKAVKAEQMARYSAHTQNERRVARQTIKLLSSALNGANPEFAASEPEDYDRPRVRRDCLTAEQAGDGLGDGSNAARPCPWISCRYHLYLDVNPETGTISYPFPDSEPWEIQSTCALDLADEGEATLIAIGQLLAVSKEAIRLPEEKAIEKMQRSERRARALGKTDAE